MKNFELIIKSNNIKVLVDDVKSYDGKSIFGKIDLFKKNDYQR